MLEKWYVGDRRHRVSDGKSQTARALGFARKGSTVVKTIQAAINAAECAGLIRRLDDGRYRLNY